ncbi:hypothetical protein [Natrinema pallidum]|uniref:Uncharacterized protein n=1 Tax=Natrinema pallidum TaxID=69527 RepID=A0A4P9TJT8_9EURY|nr:hypothetical protein [Natrinema pallidum]QCW05268.1 hypothetical protein FGF80_18670 [Natrinema pallidum]
MTETDEIDGSYPGTTENMAKVGTRDGVVILECLYCGDHVQKNWGTAKAHTCGRGAEVDGVGCCDDPALVDEWVMLDEQDGRVSKERKKRCETCGQIHPLEVTNRATESELVD